jgi:hypothetical protein
VILVLGTGAGKMLVVMIGVAVVDVGTTILILPTVALQGDMLGHFYKVGIQPLIWSIGCR